VVKKQWQLSQQLVSVFWSRWVKEYLPTLLDFMSLDSMLANRDKT
jgi:hypothetical protein